MTVKPISSGLVFMRPDVLGEIHAGSYSGPQQKEPSVLAADGTDAGDNGRGPIALVPVYGPMSAHRGWYGTSVRGVVRAVEHAVADPGIEQVILDMDTPGGTALGMAEASDAIKRAAQRKSVHALVRGGLCCSAGVYLTAHCTSIMATRGAEVGSIGAWSLLLDDSAFLERIGIRFIPLRTAPGKARAMLPGDTITDEDVEFYTQRLIDRTQMFFDAVKKGRGLNAAQMAAVSTGDYWLGPEAKRLGLVDEIVRDLAHAVQLITKGKRSGARSSARNDAADAGTVPEDAETPPRHGEDMPDEAESPQRVTSVAQLEREYPDLVAEVRSSAAAEATESERTRCNRIVERAGDGMASLAATLISDGAEYATALERIMDEKPSAEQQAANAANELDKKARALALNTAAASADETEDDEVAESASEDLPPELAKLWRKPEVRARFDGDVDLFKRAAPFMDRMFDHGGRSVADSIGLRG